MQTIAEQKMSKARTQLVLTDVFFGALSMGMAMYPDPMGIMDTICIDGKQIVYNQDFIVRYNDFELKGLLAHEVMHIALKHHLRRGDRDFEVFNVACDYAIDPILLAAGYSLPDGGHIDPKFADMSAEEIYEILIKGPTGSQPSSTPTPQSSPAPAPPAPAPAAPSPAPQQKLSLPQKASDKAQPFPQIPQIKNHSGVVIDAPIDLKDNKEVKKFEEELDIALEQAIKSAGTMPAGLRELIKAEEEHKINYKDLLQDWLEKNVFPSDFNWITPNRKYFSQGILLPGLDTEEELPQIVFGVDASGSVGKKEKKAFANEICGVLEEFPCTILAIYCDTRVSHTQDLDSDDYPIELNFEGGGGTKFGPTFEYIKEHSIDAQAVLYFTDLQCSDFGEDPGIPVLWLNTVRGNDNKNVPFGEIIPLELD